MAKRDNTNTEGPVIEIVETVKLNRTPTKYDIKTVYDGMDLPFGFDVVFGRLDGYACECNKKSKLVLINKDGTEQRYSCTSCGTVYAIPYVTRKVKKVADRICKKTGARQKHNIM